MDILVILSLALAIDLILGEPPRAVHPVVWMGKVIGFLERGGINQPTFAGFVYGAGMTFVAIGLFAAPAYFILSYLRSLNFMAYVIIGGMLLKFAFSSKALRQSALKVKRLLVNDQLDEARFELRSLVSRDVHSLPRPLMVSATIESVAENTCDSFVAPLFYFLLFGVPGAIAYRVVNTLDAMVGYHGKYEYLGKFASRLDDVLNFIPARLTALLFILAAFLCQADTRASWQTTFSDHSKTESPNAGWPMAAIAGALDVQLEKTGQYKLGKANAHLEPETIDATLNLMLKAMLSWVLICFMVGGFRFVFAT
ncbi:cobalamin biosynthesis protein [Dehalococcoidia bacterium]|nr:cobalamin biosynthesis protein [Dehalococcoidia bacterium]